MKLVIAVIFALVCHMAIADPTHRYCDSTAQYYNGSQCVACPEPCKECVLKNGKPSCINCGTGTGKFLEIKEDIGVCSNCTGNCTGCRGPNVGDCFLAASDMVISPSAIVKCANLNGCLWCSSENKCGKCKVGFRLANDTCTPCDNAQCADCSDSVSNCKKCGYWNQLKDNTCHKCDLACTACPCTGCVSGYAYFNNTCTPCNDTKCTTCATNATQCTACKTGYFLNSTCQKCGDNCAECTAADKCSKCSFGFVSKDGKCVPCTANCWTCNTNDECTDCYPGFYASTDKKTCTPCPAGCDGCGAEGVCTKCKAGYIAKQDKKGCDACTTSGFCLECTDATHCKTCQPGYNPDGKGQCKSIEGCGKGKALDGNGTCVDGTIDNCFYGNNMTSSCWKCADGYYAKDKGCTVCPNGCEECEADSKGYVKCTSPAQYGFSVSTSSGKADNVGYLGKDIVLAVSRDGRDAACMPNNWLASYTLNSTKKQCVAYDKCPILKKVTDWECKIEGNAVKMTLSLFAVVVATLFTL